MSGRASLREGMMAERKKRTTAERIEHLKKQRAAAERASEAATARAERFQDQIERLSEDAKRTVAAIGE